jgi:hypothetical protein
MTAVLKNGVGHGLIQGKQVILTQFRLGGLRMWTLEILTNGWEDKTTMDLSQVDCKEGT